MYLQHEQKQKKMKKQNKIKKTIVRGAIAVRLIFSSFTLFLFL